MQFADGCVVCWGRKDEEQGMFSISLLYAFQPGGHLCQFLRSIFADGEGTDLAATFLLPRTVQHDVDSAVDALRLKVHPKLCLSFIEKVEVEVFVTHHRAVGN